MGQDSDMTEGAAAQTPTPAQIISALGRTGFLLEQVVAQKLRKAGFAVAVNDAFPDPDTGKSREIDVLALTDYEVPNSELSVFGDVIIECKNYATPIVLIGTSREAWDFYDESITLSFDPLALNFPSESSKSVITKLDIGRVAGNDQKERFVGYQLVKMERKSGGWAADNSSIYESILYPLAKARVYRMRQYSNEQDEGERRLEVWQSPHLAYYFPVVLTAGQVYTVAVNDETEPEVAEVKWATLRRLFASQGLRTNLRADVVSAPHFDEYITKRIMRTVNNAYTKLKSNTQLYDPEWLLDNLGEPQHKKAFSAWLEYARERKSN